MSNATE